MKGLIEASRVVARRLELTQAPSIPLSELAVLADKEGYRVGRKTALFLDLLDYGKTLPETHEIYWDTQYNQQRVRKK